MNHQSITTRDLDENNKIVKNADNTDKTNNKVYSRRLRSYTTMNHNIHCRIAILLLLFTLLHSTTENIYCVNGLARRSNGNNDNMNNVVTDNPFQSVEVQNEFMKKLKAYIEQSRPRFGKRGNLAGLSGQDDNDINPNNAQSDGIYLNLAQSPASSIGLTNDEIDNALMRNQQQGSDMHGKVKDEKYIRMEVRRYLIPISVLKRELMSSPQQLETMSAPYRTMPRQYNPQSSNILLAD